MRQARVWIELVLPAARVVGELRCRVGGAQGVSPADVLSTAISSQPQRRVSITAHFKALMRWGSSRSRVAMASSLTMAAGDGSTVAVGGDFWRSREAQGPRTSMYFVLF